LITQGMIDVTSHFPATFHHVDVIVQVITGVCHRSFARATAGYPWAIISIIF